MKDYRIPVDDMVEAIEKIADYVAGRNEVQFSSDEKLQDAVIRRFGIIGEAATRIPKNIRVLTPDIPWKSIVGLRNIVIHDYASVSLGKAWEVIQRDLPKLKKDLLLLQKILDEQQSGSAGRQDG